MTPSPRTCGGGDPHHTAYETMLVRALCQCEAESCRRARITAKTQFERVREEFRHAGRAVLGFSDQGSTGEKLAGGEKLPATVSS
jgi:hypothetical protein